MPTYKTIITVPVDSDPFIDPVNENINDLDVLTKLQAVVKGSIESSSANLVVIPRGTNDSLTPKQLILKELITKYKAQYYFNDEGRLLKLPENQNLILAWKNAKVATEIYGQVALVVHGTNPLLPALKSGAIVIMEPDKKKKVAKKSMSQEWREWTKTTVPTYKCRVECIEDIDRVKKAFAKNQITYRSKSQDKVSGFPDWTWTFTSETDLKTLKTIISKVPDAHVCLETLTLEKDYTGERVSFTPEPTINDTTEPEKETTESVKKSVLEFMIALQLVRENKEVGLPMFESFMDSLEKKPKALDEITKIVLETMKTIPEESSIWSKFKLP